MVTDKHTPDTDPSDTSVRPEGIMRLPDGHTFA